MYNLIKYSDNYSKRSRNLQQYYRDQPDNAIVNSELFKSKIMITGNTPADIYKKKMLKQQYHSNTKVILGELLKGLQLIAKLISF